MAWWNEPGNRPRDIVGRASGGSGGARAGGSAGAGRGAGFGGRPVAGGSAGAGAAQAYEWARAQGAAGGQPLPGGYTPLSGGRFDWARFAEREAGRPAYEYRQRLPLPQRGGVSFERLYRPDYREVERERLGRVLDPAVDWFQQAAARVRGAGRGQYTPVRPIAAPAAPEVQRGLEALGVYRQTQQPPQVITPATFGAASADIWRNITQAGAPGRAAAALGEAATAVGGGLLRGVAAPAEEAERAIGGTAVGLYAVGRGIQERRPLPELGYRFSQGYQMGREALGPVAYTLAGEQLGQAVGAIGGPESGTLAPMFQTPAPAGVERARQAFTLAQQGYTPAQIREQVGNPLYEAIGQTLLDPLNFVGVGATARRQTGEVGLARRYFTEASAETYDDVARRLATGADPRPATGPIGSIANEINPRTAAARADALIEDTSDITTMLTQGAETAEQRLSRVRALVDLADPNPTVAEAARNALVDFGDIPNSQAGKQATVFLRKLATDEAGNVDFGVIERVMRQAETPEAAAEALVRRMENAASEFYAVKRGAEGGVKGTGFLADNPVRRFQNGINGVLSRYLHLGYSPSYAHRNLATNLLHAAVDGTLPFNSATDMGRWTERFSYRTRAATRAVGGAAGLKAGEQVVQRFKPIQMGEAYRTLLTKEAWKQGPSLALGQAFEQWTGERVWYKATRSVWERAWRYGRGVPSSAVVDSLPGPLRNYVLGRVNGAMDAADLRRLATEIRGRAAAEAWRVPDGALLDTLRQANPELADEVLRAGIEAASPEEFAARLDDLLNRADDHVSAALADDTPMLTQADPAADDVTLIAQTEGPGAATETARRIAAGRQQRDAARVMAWTRLDDAPLPARAAIDRVQNWIGQNIVDTYRQADAATAEYLARRMSFDQAEAIKSDLWQKFAQAREAQYQRALQEIGEQGRGMLLLRQADDAVIAQAAQTKQRAASVWARYRAGEIPYDAAKTQVEQLWTMHNRYSVTQYDQSWRLLGGDPVRGPLARIGLDPIQRSPAVLRRELAATALDAGIPGARINAAGDLVPHPRLLNTINKELDAVGLPRVRHLGDLDAQQMEAAIAGLRRRAAAQAPTPAAVAEAAPPPAAVETLAEEIIGPSRAEAMNLDDYASASSMDPGRMTPNDWGILAQNLRAEGQRLVQRGDELARQVGVSTRRGAVEDIEAFGTTVRGRQGGISRRAARELEEGLSREARAAALEDMGTVLERAGFTPDELSHLDYQQRRRILEEIGQGDLSRTQRGKPATIDDIPAERRAELIGVAQPDVARIAGATATEPTTGRGYTLLTWAEDAERRAEAVRWAGSLDAGQRAGELEGLRGYRDNLVSMLRDATPEETLQLQDELRDIEARLWALEPPKPRRVAPRRAAPEPVPQPEIPRPSPAELAAEPPQRVIDEIVESFDAAPPPRAATAAESATRTEPILQAIRDGINPAVAVDVGRLDPRTAQQVERWLNSLVPRLNETKAIASRVGSMERDFTLLNYADRRVSDQLLSYVLMYGYWPTRTVVNWTKRIANNPALLGRYMRYKQAQNQMNKDLPEWWRQQIAVNPFGLLDNPLYMNIEQTLNPLYQMVSDFNDRDRGGAGRPLGELMQQVGDIGAGNVWMPLQFGYALALSQRGDAEGAQAWAGYLGTPTRTLHYATSLLGELGVNVPPGGVVLEPWLWQGGMFQGGDKWERRRIGKALYDLVREGTITYEQMVDAAYSQRGPLWDQATQRAAVQRAPGVVAGWLFGQGFKSRFAYEIEIDRASGEWFTIMEGRAGMSPEQYAAARDEFLSRYPWMPAIWMSKKGDIERDTSMAWDALYRLPPGNERQRILEAARMPQELLDRFYQDPDMTGWTQPDRDRFMAAVLDMAAVLQVPDAVTKQEWAKVKRLNTGIYNEASRRWPGIDATQDEYFRISGSQGEQAARAYLERHPELREYWEFKTQRMTDDPTLFAYYGEQTDLERRALNDLYDEAERRWPGVQDTQAQYYQLKDTGGDARGFLDGHPELREYWDYIRIGKEFIKEFPPPAPRGTPAIPARVRPDLMTPSPTQDAIAAGLQTGPTVPQAPTPPPAIQPVIARGPGLPAPTGVTPMTTPAQPAAPTLPRAPQQLEQWRDLIEQNAQTTGLDPRILATVMYIESRGRPDAVSSEGAIGLMQVMPQGSGPVFADRPTAEQLSDPAFNVEYGSGILKSYIDYFDGDARKGIAAYYMGRSAVETKGLESEDARVYLGAFDKAWSELWGGEALSAPPAGGAPAAGGMAGYTQQMQAATGDPLAWVYQHGSAEELQQELKSRMYDEAERRFPGMREASAEYGKLKDGGASKAELKEFRESHPGITDYWDFTSAGRDFLKENELAPGGTQRELDAYIDRMLGGTGGTGITPRIALDMARKKSDQGDDFHLGPRNRQYNYRMKREVYEALPAWVKSQLGANPYATPLKGGKSSGRGGGGGGWGGRRGRRVSPYLLRLMTPQLQAQIRAFFAGGPALEEGALRELTTLGITDVESLRAMFAANLPAPLPAPRSSSKSKGAWRSW
jgi:hypothetical protein